MPGSRFLPVLLLAGLAGCASEPLAVFPPVAARTEAEILAILAARTRPARSFYAVLELAYDGPERSGAFEGVFHYREPGEMRMTAHKTVLVSTRLVFDVVLARERYFLEMEEEEGVSIRDSGDAGAFPDLHPGLALLYWVREAFCAPGSVSATVPGPAVRESGDAIRVATRLTSGAAVTWILDPATLRVDRAVVTAPGEGEITLVYGDYEDRGGVFVPRWVRLEDPARRTTVTARALEFEVNPEIEDWVFEFPSTDG